MMPRTLASCLGVLVLAMGLADSRAWAGGRWGGGGSVLYSGSFVNRVNSNNDYGGSYVGGRRSQWGVNQYGDLSMTAGDVQQMQQSTYRPATTYANGSVYSGSVQYSGQTVNLDRPLDVPVGPAPWVSGAAGQAGRSSFIGGVRTKLPEGSTSVVVGETRYWRCGYDFYRPYWYSDETYYLRIYPPVGYWYAALPPGAAPVAWSGATGYYGDGVYYVDKVQDSRNGYAVVEAPAGNPTPSPQGQDPLKILKGACDYLGQLNRFTGVVETTADKVLASGDKVQLAQRRIVYVSRPDKLAVDVSGNGDDRRFVYDGLRLAMLDRTKNVYAVTAMPATIEAMLAKAAQDYAVVLPLGDFLRQGAYDGFVTQIKSSRYIGLEQVGAVQCRHLAFAGEAADWQVWIAVGDAPAPYKIVIDRRQGALRLRYSATIVAWMVNPPFAAGTFEFAPPADAAKIEIVPAGR